MADEMNTLAAGLARLDVVDRRPAGGLMPAWTWLMGAGFLALLTPAQAQDAEPLHFSVPPGSNGAYMCPAGHIRSYVSTMDGSDKAFGLVPLDAQGKPLPDTAWSSAVGMRLDEPQAMPVEISITCGG